MKLNLAILILFVGLINQARASGCYATYLEGTNMGYGRLPLISSSLMATSSFLLKSEGGADNSDKSKRDAMNAGFVASGIYFYVSLFSLCKTVDRKEYDRLVSERDKLLKEGKKFYELPHNLSYIRPIPSIEEYKDMIKIWKRRQKFLLFMVGGLDSAFLLEQANQADQQGTKYFAYGSIAAILGMALFDIDDIWGDKNPYWVDFNVITTKINLNYVPAAVISFKF